MSLVNDLLKDIRQRDGDIARDDRSQAEGFDPARPELLGERVPMMNPSHSRSSVGRFAVPVTCIVILAIELGVRLAPATIEPPIPSVSAKPPIGLNEQGISPSRVVNEVPGAIRPQATLAQAKASPLIPEAEIAEVVDVEIEATDHYTRVSFSLSQEREYWIKGDPLEGQIELVIGGTHLSGAFAHDAFERSGLTLRSTHNTSTGLHLVFGLDAPSRVQSQSIATGTSSRLVLDIIAAAPEWNQAASAADAWHSLPAVRTDEANAGETHWGTINKTTTPSDSAQPQSHVSLDRARELVAQERKAEAIAEYIRALTFAPLLHEAREGLVFLLIDDRQFAAAQRHLTEGLSIAPEHSEYTFQKAQLLVAMEQPERAIAILESLPTPVERRSEALNLLAALYQQQGDHPRAEALFRTAVQLAPYQSRLWMGLGISLEQQSRATEALAVYKQAESLSDFEPGPQRWLRHRIRELSTVE